MNGIRVLGLRILGIFIGIIASSLDSFLQKGYLDFYELIFVIILNLIISSFFWAIEAIIWVIMISKAQEVKNNSLIENQNRVNYI